ERAQVLVGIEDEAVELVDLASCPETRHETRRELVRVMGCQRGEGGKVRSATDRFDSLAKPLVHDVVGDPPPHQVLGSSVQLQQSLKTHVAEERALGQKRQVAPVSIQCL